MRTQAVLPDGMTVRAPGVGDAEAIFGLLSGYNTGVVGIADCRLEQVADGLVEPGFEPGTDGWLVVASDGAAVGYGLAFAMGDQQTIQLEVTSSVAGVAEWLFRRAMERAREMGRQAGHGEITVDFFVYQDDETQRGLLSAQGFDLGATYYKMRIEHNGAVTAPDVPAGVVVRWAMEDDASRWVAHEVIIECFTGQFGFVARPHDEWLAFRESSSMMSWSQLVLLEIDGKAVAFRDCNDESLEENSGRIGGLGVLPQYRGRGLAKYLLRDAFALDAAAGLGATTLLVDTNNPTRALDLYLSVGMTPVLVHEGWRRTLPVG